MIETLCRTVWLSDQSTPKEICLGISFYSLLLGLSLFVFTISIVVGDFSLLIGMAVVSTSNLLGVMTRFNTLSNMEII